MKRILPLLIACMALTACAGGVNAAPETTGADEITSASEPVAETPGTTAETADETTTETTRDVLIAELSAQGASTAPCKSTDEVRSGLLQLLSESESMTETLFPTIDIEGFTMIGAKITDTRTVLYLYIPTGRVTDGDDCEFDLSDGIVIGVKHPDDVDPGKPLAIPLGRAEGKYYFLSEKTLQVVDSNEISAAVQQTFFSMLVPDSLSDHDTLLDLAVRVRDSMELVKYKKPVERQTTCGILLTIFNVENLDGKDALKADILSMLKGLERFRNLSEDTVMTMMHSTDESLSYEYMIYDSYVRQDIESLESFWFPTADIEGFTLSYASVEKTAILYFYAPNDELMSDDFSYDFKNCIIIAISRESFGDNDPLDGIRSGNRDREYTERDGMIFTPSYNEVDVRLDKTRFKLMTPKSITTDADTLFDLAARIRDSMELITLD